MFGFFDDECDVLEDTRSTFVPDMAADYPCAWSAAGRNFDFDDDTFGFLGEVGTGDFEATALSKKSSSRLRESE
jgi:hypothetical protein